MDVGRRITLRFTLAAGAIAALCSTATACSSKGAPEASASVAPPPHAPDQVASGEVAESASEAFGLKLPQGLRVTRRDYNMVTAEGSLKPEDVSNYIREHTTPASVETGPGRTSFLHAGVKEPSTDWKGTLRIDVEGEGNFTSIRVLGEPFPPPSPSLQRTAINTADVRTPPPGGAPSMPPKL